jgi:hypothetical protein
MNAKDTTPRYLGAAFLVVVLTSLVSGVATDAATGSGSVDEVLTTVAGNSGMLHFATVAGMLNAVGILVLAALLYAVLHSHGKVLALAAALCWTGESFFYALNQLAVTALAHVASDFQSAGGGRGPDVVTYRSLGQFLYTDVTQRGGTVLMFFYCAGGVLFYSLFYRSRLVPRWISGYGVIAVTIGIAGAAIELLGHPLGLLPYVAIGPFEIIIGLYLLTRGTTTGSNTPAVELAAV